MNRLRCLSLAVLLAVLGCAGHAHALGAPGPYMLVGPIVEGEGAFFADWIARSKRAGVKRLDVVIHSNGGELDEAEIMIKALRGAGIPSRCEARGLVASAAFLVFEACDRRAMVHGARLLIHRVSVSSHGTWTLEELQRVVADLAASIDAVDTAVARRLGMPLAAYRARLAAEGGEWVMDEDAAIDANAVDVVTP